jgi:hyperosmotically inducible periplasmic protein
MSNLVRKVIGSLATVTLLSALMAAQAASAARYDSSIDQKVTQRLSEKKQFRNVQTNVEDGIVTLRGTVDLYQDKLDAAKKIRKDEHVAGVRNLIEVAGPAVSDAQLQSKLAKKLRYDRVGYYDNAFNYLALGVKDGVVTVSGETMNDVGRDSALAIVQRMPGVKDVIDEIRVSPVSPFDDSIRLQTVRALYRDPVLGKYATDPSAPIRIVVDNGTVGLYGAVDSAMDKQIAGIRANEVFGAFRVENHLTVD